MTSNNTTTTSSVADTIYRQLGGNKFRVMTGARNFTWNDTSLMFRLPKSHFTHVSIKLNAMDLYDVVFMRIRGTKVQGIKAYRNIYVENLVELFERETGLYTRL